MPLVLLSGFPASGKTYRAQQLATYFETRLASSHASAASNNSATPSPRPPNATTPSMTVTVISDHSLHIARSAYATAAAEKTARAVLSAAIIRALTPVTLVIADAPNYIKGFRYQLFCEAKAARTASCVVHVGTPVEKCTAVNEERLAASQTAETPLDEAAVQAPYEAAVFDNLIARYEEPNGMTRWDSPLFTVPYDDPEPPCDAIWDALIGTDGQSRAARPNAATVVPAATPMDALNALERASQAVVERIGTWVQDHAGEEGGSVSIPDVVDPVVLPMKNVTLAQLQRSRRQFVSLYRREASDLKPERMKATFVTFLNDTWGTSGT